MRRPLLLVLLVTVCSCGFNNRNKQVQPQQAVIIDTISADPIAVKDTVPADPETLPKMLNPEDLLKEGEDTLGNFRVKYSVYLNEIIADTIFVSPTESEVWRNHSLFLSVHYNDDLIVDNTEIRSTSFEGIDNPEKFVLVPIYNRDVSDEMDGIDFSSINDTLIIWTTMSRGETCWGYQLDIKISKDGDISSRAY